MIFYNSPTAGEHTLVIGPITPDMKDVWKELGKDGSPGGFGSFANAAVRLEGGTELTITRHQLITNLGQLMIRVWYDEPADLSIRRGLVVNAAEVISPRISSIGTDNYIYCAKAASARGDLGQLRHGQFELAEIMYSANQV